MPSPAVLFDLDGTLVDTTYLHTLAWWRALDEAGEHAPMAAINPLVGMGGPELLTTLLGSEHESISERHGELFAELHPLVRVLPGARELLHRVRDAGGQVLVVTSAKERDLPVLLGSLDCDDVIGEVVNAGEAPGKPAPDLFEIALHRAGCPPAGAIAVGDSVWDVKAGARAGIPVVGIATGGTPQEHLREAGAVATYRSCPELIDLWVTSPLAELLGVAGAGNRGEAGGGRKATSFGEPLVRSDTHAPDVTVLLTEEHGRLTRFVEELGELRRPAARRDALVLLAERMARHETAEQEALYPVLNRLPGGSDLKRRAVAQERALQRHLVRTMRRSVLLPAGRGFHRDLETLAGMLEEHRAFEEERVFPLLRAAEHGDKRRIMGSWVSHAERLAPTRPHPHVPPRLGALVALGPGLAAADRMRERARRWLTRGGTAGFDEPRARVREADIHDEDQRGSAMTTAMPTLVDRLSEDHTRVEEALSRLPQIGLRGLEQYFCELHEMLVRHEVAEELIVYPAFRDAVPNGDAIADARIAEQSKAEAKLKAMEKENASTESFRAQLEELKTEVLEHAIAEEREVFPLLRQHLSHDDLVALGDRYEKAIRSAPTHPHPHAPDSPPGNVVLGPVAALMDRMRDAMRGAA
jgi:HAD superfamily hydrolase (TIGR01509 family)